METNPSPSEDMTGIPWLAPGAAGQGALHHCQRQESRGGLQGNTWLDTWAGIYRYIDVLIDTEP